MRKKLAFIAAACVVLIIFGGINSTLLYGTQYMTTKPGYSFSVSSGADWWNCNWSYCKKITIDHTKVGSDQTNFPVLIYESADVDLATNAQSDGGDIAFVDHYNTTQYKHEIEEYNSSTGELTAWVKVSSLSSTLDTILYMYYGNPTCTNQQNISETWDSNFKMVQHLNQTSIFDSTSNDNDGTNNGATANTSSKIDGGYDFDGSDNITVNDASSLNITNSITLEGWAKDPPLKTIEDDTSIKIVDKREEKRVIIPGNKFSAERTISVKKETELTFITLFSFGVKIKDISVNLESIFEGFYHKNKPNSAIEKRIENIRIKLPEKIQNLDYIAYSKPFITKDLETIKIDFETVLQNHYSDGKISYLVISSDGTYDYESTTHWNNSYGSTNWNNPFSILEFIIDALKSKDLDENPYGITAQQAKDMVNSNKNAIIFDIRSEEDYSSNYIYDSISIPLLDFNCSPCLLSRLEDYKDNNVIIYGENYLNKIRAFEFLSSYGFSDIKILIDNITVCKNEGFSIISISDVRNIELDIENNLNLGKSVLLYFFTDNCDICKIQDDILIDVNKKYSNELEIIYINKNQNPSLFTNYGIDSYPSLFLISDNENGYTYKNFSGLVNKSVLDNLFINLKNKVNNQSYFENWRKDEIYFNKPLSLPSEVAEEISQIDNVQVIIKYKDKKNFTKKVSELEEDGFIKKSEISSKGYISGVINKSVYDTIKFNNDISEIFPDKNYTTLLEHSLPIIRYTEAINEFNVTGVGKKICIIDTGVDSSIVNYSYGYDFVHDDDIPDDEYGHGTKVASIIKSIAPDAELIVAKVIGASGIGYESDVLEAIEWCIEQNPDVISFSIGSQGGCDGFCDGDFVAEMSNDAVDQGIFVVAAAGNDGDTYLKSPSCGSKVFSVSATGSSDNVASFSNVNPTLDMFAPGVKIKTPTGIGRGTSFSAPHVSAAALLVLEQNDLDPNELSYRLKSTGKPINHIYYDENFSINYPRLDIYNAIINNKTLEPFDYSGWQQGVFTEGKDYYALDTAGYELDCNYDSFVSEYYNGYNYGTCTYMYVDPKHGILGSQQQINRMFIDVSSSGIPSYLTNARIDDADLNVYYYGYSGSSPASRTHNCYIVSAVPSQWVEGARCAATAQGSELDWDNQNSATTYTDGRVLGSTYEYKDWDVTSNFQSRVLQTTTYGWMIRDSSETGSTSYAAKYYSNDYSSGSKTPYVELDYQAAAEYISGAANLFAGKKSTTIITEHIDGGCSGTGCSYVDDCRLRISAGLSSFTLNYNVDTNAFTIYAGSSYVSITGCSVTETAITGGYRLTWQFIPDWDFLADDFDYDVVAWTDDELGYTCGYITYEAGSYTFENDIEVVSLTLSIDDNYEYGGTAGQINDNDFFNGGYPVTATGTVEYQGSSQTFDSSYDDICSGSTEVQLFYDTDEDGTPDDLGSSYKDNTISSGSFSIPAYTPADDKTLETNADWDVAIQGICSGGSDVTAAGIEVDCTRDDEVPTATTNAQCRPDGYEDEGEIDDDTEIYFTWDTSSDGSGSGIDTHFAEIGDATPDEDAGNDGEDTDTGVEGLNTYYVWARDNVYNYGKADNDTITISISYAPTQSGESPTNESTGVSVTPALYVIVSDEDGDTMNATWWSNSSESWVQFAYNNSISPDTNITQTNSNFSSYNTKYYWSVNVSDGEGEWNNETYHFTTVADTTIPTSSIDTISPYEQTSSPLSITATASDSESGLKNVTLYYRYSSDNFTAETDEIGVIYAEQNTEQTVERRSPQALVTLDSGDFIVGDEYLLVASAHARADDDLSDCVAGLRIRHGGSVFTETHEQQSGPSDENSAWVYFTFINWTAVSEEDIDLYATQDALSVLNVYFDEISLMAIPLDNLTENSDYWYDDDTSVSDDMDDSWSTSGASITFTPDGSSDYLVMGTSRCEIDAVSDDLLMMRLTEDTGAVKTEKTAVERDGESSNDESVLSLIYVLESPAVPSKTYGLDFCGDNVHDKQSSQIFILNLSAFFNYTYNQTSANTEIPHSTWTELGNASGYNPTFNGTVITFWGGRYEHDGSGDPPNDPWAAAIQYQALSVKTGAASTACKQTGANRICSWNNKGNSEGPDIGYAIMFDNNSVLNTNTYNYLLKANGEDGGNAMHDDRGVCIVAFSQHFAGEGWTKWNDASNPDTDPWVAASWNFNFPNGTGYYEFYSIAEDNSSNMELAPSSDDASCYYNPTTVSAPTVTTNASIGIEETNATLRGYLQNNGSADTTCGFRFGTSSGTYSENFSVGTIANNTEFGNNNESLSQGQIYFYQAWASNSEGFANGSEMTFLTKPNVPSSFISQRNSTSMIYLSWTGGTGYNTTYIERNASDVTVWARGDGTEIYNGSGTNYEDTGLLEGLRYYYQAWTFANWTYNPTIHQWSDENSSTNQTTNNEPTQSGESPTNESLNICPIPALYVICTDNDGDTMNATWRSNISGAWVDFASNNSIANNTNITQTNSNFSNPGTTYYWSINLTDGEGGWSNETYHFTTNSEPTQSGESPVNQSTGITTTPALYVICTDADSDTMTATWRSNSSETWVDFATNTSISTGTNITQTNTNFSDPGVTYHWSINLTDGCNWTNATYHFTTGAGSPTVTTNAATGVEETNATLNGLLNDDGNGTTTCGFWLDTTSGGTSTNITVGTVSEGNAFSNNSSDLIPGQLYYFTAWANNSGGFSTGIELTFLTKPNATVSGTLNIQTNSSSVIYLTWTAGDGANTTYIERNQSGVTSWDRGEGIEVYNDSGSNYEDAGLTAGVIYYYQAWSYATWTYNPTLDEWSDDNESGSNTTNNKPILSNENPSNESTGVSLNPTLEIQVNHSDSLQMDITWYWGADSSCPNLVGTNYSKTNGTYSQADVDSNFSSNSQTYYWKVCVNDSQGEWTNATYHFTTIGANKEIISKGQNAYSLEMNPGGTTVYGYINSNSATCSIDTNWHYVVLTYDGSTIRLYRDGDEVDDTSYSSSINTNNNDLKIGEYLTGTLDELRISNTARSADWINTTYYNTNSPTTFATFGSQEGILKTWSYRKQIWINASMIDEDLTNFPVLISTTDDDLKNNAHSSGNDIMFMITTVDWMNGSYTDKLAHEIEKYDNSNGELVAWVNVTSLSSSTNTTIYMYYGNTVCTANREDVTNVWDSNFVGIWHLHDAPSNGQNHNDSTSNDHDLTLHDTDSDSDTDATGIANGADDLEGDADYMDENHHSDFNLSSFSLECWVTLDDKSDHHFMINKQIDDSTDRNFALYSNTTDGIAVVTFSNSGGGTETANGNTDLTSTGWHYVVGINDGSNLRLYVNSSSEGTADAVASNPSTQSVPLMIGRENNSADPEYWDGKIDEVRISKIARNTSWINATYNTTSSPSLFIAFGGQEIQNVAPTQSSPSPSDGATGQGITPTLSIQVNDTNIDAMNVTFYTNVTGSWGLIGYNDSVYNGTYSQTNESMDSPNTKYWWSVNVTDYTAWANRTYNFTTTPPQTLTIRPINTGQSEQLANGPLGVPDNPNWQSVDEETHNGDTDFVYTDDQATYINDTYILQPHTTETGDINNVTIYLVGTKYGTGGGPPVDNDMKPAMYNGGARDFYDSDTSVTLTTSYVTYSWNHDTNPFTSSNWTWTEIDQLQVGVALIGRDYQYSNCTQVYVEVNYTPSASPFLYLFRDKEFRKLSDFIPGAIALDNKYTQLIDITRKIDIIDGKVMLKITEELDETTYLDHIYLRINDGQIVELDNIKTQLSISKPLTEESFTSLINRQLLRYSDDHYLILKEGDEYYLEFTLPKTYDKIEFVAEGYYIEHYKA